MTEYKLRTSYGIVTLKKGTILYHTSKTSLEELSSNIPLLFTTLHPSEWSITDNYISKIELQRNVSLLFMVDKIKDSTIYSALSIFLGVPNSNIEAKRNNELVKCWIPELIKEKLDGWFTSIENGDMVEFAIFSDPTILKIIDFSEYKNNSKNIVYNSNNNSILMPKNWGINYPISCKSKPVKMVLNIRFKPQIKEYIKYVEKENPNGTVFYIILKNAKIKYFEAPIEKIKWFYPTHLVNKQNNIKTTDKLTKKIRIKQIN
jgi:hypothetical protein